MNRIILIGNGFDLAHQMKTSYNNFLNNFWIDINKEVQKKEYENEKYEDEFIIIDRVPTLWIPGFGYDQLINSINDSRTTLRFKNKFLETLTKTKNTLNWVDIESDYYTLLKSCFQKPNPNYSIKDLNENFYKIQEKLEQYLVAIENEFIKSFPSEGFEINLKRKIYNEIYSDFNLRDFSEASINRLTELEFQNVSSTLKDLDEGVITLNEVNIAEREKRLLSALNHTKDKKRKIRELLTSPSSPNYFRFRPREIMFLNFNYTQTEGGYESAPNDDEFKDKIPTITNHIHGILNNKTDNKMIFGFGDEIDNDYRIIEDLDDNEYLQNIKSIKYLESSSYKSLLEFINSDDYQIFIFGHSCGISDRTLLNTLFENKNCCSIKPFYRQIDVKNDNYSEIIKNISRNFTNKATMRDRVVNKIFTKPLFS